MKHVVELTENQTFRPAIWEGYINCHMDQGVLGYYVPALEAMLDESVEANTTVTLKDGTIFDVYTMDDGDGDTHALFHNRELNLTTTFTNEIPVGFASVEDMAERTPVVHGTNEQFAAIIAGL